LILFLFLFQKLAGATLLVFSNKKDLPGALSAEEIRDVSLLLNKSY
jgi:signal recognition particle receptor subunit beta